jgi:POT family proton-dependent oligopeptide transporter
VIFWLFLLVAVFWSGFEQAGTSLNLFARDLTDRMIGSWELPASWLQSVNALMIIIGAPIFGSLWVWLERRSANPSIPMKAGLGLMGLAAGFFVLAWGAANATPDSLVSPSWLVVTYFLHTVGELCISPIGLSAITKLSPERRVGQMMGIWFVGAALGNLFAGLVAGQLETMLPHDLFRTVAMIIGGVGVLALALAPQVKKWAGGVR